MTDTDPETAARYRAMLMALSPSERFAMGLRMCEAAREIVLGSLPRELSHGERRKELLRRYYGSELGERGIQAVATALD